MKMNQLLEVVTVEARSKGVDQTTAATEKLAKATDSAVVASDKQSKATLSNERALERLQRQIDMNYRQQRMYEAGQRTLDRALNAGKLSVEGYDRALGLLGSRYASTTTAVNDNVRSVGQLSAVANSSAGRITAFTGALSGAALAGAVLATGLATVGGAIAKAGDEFTTYRNRLLVAGEDQNKLNARLAQLGDIAIRSRTGLEPVIDLYSGLSKSTAELGKTQTQVARVTETISKAFAANGTSASTSAGAILQLNQAMASGVLRGDELNSVLEGAPALARLIAREFNVAVGELKSLGEDGKLSADRVFDAFLNGSKEVDTTFNQTATTIAQASTNAGTSLAQLGAELDALLGIAARVVGGLNAVAGAIRGIAGSVASFGDTRKLQDIQSSLQSIQQFETNIAGLRGKNDYASKMDLAAETAKLVEARASYDKLISARITEMVPRQADILLNADGMVTTARATRTAAKAMDDLNTAEKALAKDGMSAVQKATAEANQAFQDRQKVAAQMRADGVENAKIADFETRSQKLLTEQIKQANEAAAKKGGAGKSAGSSSGVDGFDNATQRYTDQIAELKLQQEQASRTGVELYKLQATHRLYQAAVKAGRGNEAGLTDQIEKTATAYALQRKATEDAIEAQKKYQESVKFTSDLLTSFVEDVLTGSLDSALKSIGKAFLSASLDALIKGGGTVANAVNAEETELGALFGLSPISEGSSDERDQRLQHADRAACRDGWRGLSVGRHPVRRRAEGAPGRASPHGDLGEGAEHRYAVAC